MKIFFYYKFCILGGVTTQLANRGKFLREKCEPHFGFAGDYGGTVAFEGDPHVAILETPEQIAAYLRLHDFDTVITIDTYELYEALELAQYNKLVIHEVHTTYTEALDLLRERKDQLPFRHVITPSRYMQQYLAGIGIADACQINNCLDLAQFRYELAKPGEELAFQPVPGKKLVLWVGKLDSHKNWKLFLAIASQLNARRDDLQFLLVGGYTAPAEVKEELAWRCEQLGLANLQWIPKVDYGEMYRYYSQVARSGGLYISTSSNESFGMAVIEAMACRCPVVVPAVGALPELLPGELAFSLYPPGEEQACVEQADRLLGDSGLRERLIALGEEQVHANYSLSAVGEAYMDRLQSFMGRR